MKIISNQKINLPLNPCKQNEQTDPFIPAVFTPFFFLVALLSIQFLHYLLHSSFMPLSACLPDEQDVRFRVCSIDSVYSTLFEASHLIYLVDKDYRQRSIGRGSIRPSGTGWNRIEDRVLTQSSSFSH